MKSFIAIPPGETLKMELDARAWSQADLSDVIGKPIQAINEIINGKRAITTEYAIVFSEAFKTSPEFWMNLETQYQLSNMNSGESEAVSQVEGMANIYELLPIRELISRGVLAEFKSLDELKKSVCNFFRVKSWKEVKPATSYSYRRKVDDSISQGALCAWAQLVKNAAEQIDVAEYSESKFRSFVDNIVTLSVDEENISELPGVLAAHGVKLVYVEHLRQTKVDGVMIWDGNVPIIGMSLRLNRNDNYWFTLLHEIGHVLNDRKTSEFHVDQDVGKPDLELDERDLNANQFAREKLIDDHRFNQFIASVKPYFYKDKVVAFAKEIGVHPAIVVGRLQYEKHIPYSHLRRLIGKVKELV